MVFISYANLDLEAAEALCAGLESRQLDCWMAPRDILPGDDWGSAIVSAIESCRLMVLVFSYRAKVSPQVRREVAHAARRDLPIVVFRMDGTEPGGAYGILEEEFAGAPTAGVPLEARMKSLYDGIFAVLDGGDLKPVELPSGSRAPVLPALALSGLARTAWRAALVVAVIRLLMSGIALQEYLSEHTGYDAARTYVAFSLPLHFASMAALLAVFTVWSSIACRFFFNWPAEVGWRVFTRVLMYPAAPGRLVDDLMRAANPGGERSRTVAWWWPLLSATLVLSTVALVVAGWDDPHPLTLIVADILPTLTWIPAAFLTASIVRQVEEAYRAGHSSPPRVQAAVHGGTRS